MTKETTAVVNLRLPSQVAAFVAKNPESAVSFLTDYMAHKKDPDAYQAAMEADCEISISAKVKTKAPLLHQAQNLIEGARQTDYGDKLENFSQIAMLFQGTLARLLLPDARILPEHVALLMMQVKIARLAKSPLHSDSTLDIAGYAGCLDILQDERDNMKELPGAIIDSGNLG